ncbi:MAG: hypothetical protein RLZZ58_214 [Pseudomonadota bacterium]
MKTLAFATLAAFALFGITPAMAADNIPAGRIYASVNEADMAAIISAEGHVIDEMHPFENPSVRGKTTDGLVFVLIGTACDVGTIKGCQGIMMQVRYDSDDTVTTEGTNASNLNEAALSAWWDKEGKTVGFTRYVILDDGVTFMNLRKNLSAMLDIVDNAQGYVFPE